MEQFFGLPARDRCPRARKNRFCRGRLNATTQRGRPRRKEKLASLLKIQNERANFLGNKFPSFLLGENSRVNTASRGGAYPTLERAARKFDALPYSVNKPKRLLRNVCAKKGGARSFFFFFIVRRLSREYSPIAFRDNKKRDENQHSGSFLSLRCETSFPARVLHPSCEDCDDRL